LTPPESFSFLPARRIDGKTFRLMGAELLMVAAALASYFTTPQSVPEAPYVNAL
jgi:hypothetical protein